MIICVMICLLYISSNNQVERGRDYMCILFIITPIYGTVPGTQQVLKKCLWNK